MIESIAPKQSEHNFVNVVAVYKCTKCGFDNNAPYSHCWSCGEQMLSVSRQIVTPTGETPCNPLSAEEVQEIKRRVTVCTAEAKQDFLDRYHYRVDQKTREDMDVYQSFILERLGKMEF